VIERRLDAVSMLRDLGSVGVRLSIIAGAVNDIGTRARHTKWPQDRYAQ
jgi:hypothetical protein